MVYVMSLVRCFVSCSIDDIAISHLGYNVRGYVICSMFHPVLFTLMAITTIITNYNYILVFMHSLLSVL